jgi:hypothetical protein
MKDPKLKLVWLCAEKCVSSTVCSVFVCVSNITFFGDWLHLSLVY